MNIFLISNAYPSEYDNVYGIFIRNFKESLEELGVNFIKCAFIKGKPKSVFHKIVSYIKLYFKIITNIFKKEIDLIYVHYPSQVAPILFVVLPFISKKLIINYHGNDIIKSNGIERLFFPMVKIMARNAVLNVVPSQYFKDIAITRLLIDSDKIFVSPSGGINADVFFKEKNQAKLNEVKTIFGFVSRIEENKGWDDFLDALFLLKKQNLKNFKAIIVGSGIEESLFMEKVKSLGLSDFIEHKKNLSQNQLRAIYNDMSVFIFPTRREAESLGLVGLEAMACGVPVIGSNIGGLTTYIVDNYNGFTFKAGDIEMLAKKMFEFHNLKNRDYLTNGALETAKAYDKKETALKLFKKLKSLF
jgi:glycosyltransferase involved in cell wall biosynthesis